MKILLIIWSLALLSTRSFGQGEFHSTFESNAFESHDPLQIIISSQPAVDQTKFNEITGELDDLVDKLMTKRDAYDNDDSFLEWAFYYVHRKKLGWYENYVSFSDIFIGKKYDCLTGTILYAYLLDRLEYKFSIYELDYHIFVVVHLPHQNVLLEATDPLNGFVNDSTMIHERMEQFLADGNSIIDIKGVGEKKSDSHAVKETANLQTLAGLQYFNLAVKAFTENNYSDAHSNIIKAEQLYPSQRIKSVKELMLSAL